MKRGILGLGLMLMTSLLTGAVEAAEPTPPPGDGLPSPLAVTVDTWSPGGGRAYVGVKARGNWAPPATRIQRVHTDYYSDWELQGAPDANRRFWWVWVRRTSTDEVVNWETPVTTHTSSRNPGIGIEPAAFGDMSLYLAVAVDPVTAPARTERAVTAELTAGWRDAVGDAMQAYIARDSVRVDRWTVSFGDGTRRIFPADGSDRLSTTHAYDAGEFEVTVTARVSGQAYGAFFTPDGVPFEQVVPFSVDITNSTSGVATLEIEYVPPVVSVGASPSGTLPDGRLVEPDDGGYAELWWPRGLRCDLFVRAIVEQEGFMRSGGVRIGGATTRLVSYRYERGVNDASDASPPGSYAADVPIRIQWNTPLPGRATYPVELVLQLETTYDDGTVRTSEVTGTVEVTVIYSAVSH